MRSVAVFHVKGGVGKTTSAVNIAYQVASEGRDTLLWDLDPQSSASWYLGVDDHTQYKQAIRLLKGKAKVGRLRVASPYPNLSVIPADASLRKLELLSSRNKSSRSNLQRLVEKLGKKQSMVIFDCAPALSDTAENVFGAVDALLIPLIPSPLSMRAYEQVLTFLKNKKLRHLKLYPFFTMVDRRRKLHNYVMDNKRRLIPGALDSVIPYASILEQMGLKRAPVGAFAPWSSPALAYKKLWRELEEKLKQ